MWVHDTNGANPRRVLRGTACAQVHRGAWERSARGAAEHSRRGVRSTSTLALPELWEGGGPALALRRRGGRGRPPVGPRAWNMPAPKLCEEGGPAALGPVGAASERGARAGSHAEIPHEAAAPRHTKIPHTRMCVLQQQYFSRKTEEIASTCLVNGKLRTTFAVYSPSNHVAAPENVRLRAIQASRARPSN